MKRFRTGHPFTGLMMCGWLGSLWAITLALLLMACGSSVVEGSGDLCPMSDGAVVPCDWECLDEAGRIVLCEDGERACWSLDEPRSCER